MGIAEWIVVAAGSAAAVITVIWFVLARQHPENADSHVEEAPPADASGRSTLHGRVVERPAGPGAEGDG